MSLTTDMRQRIEQSDAREGFKGLEIGILLDTRFTLYFYD